MKKGKKEIIFLISFLIIVSIVVFVFLTRGSVTSKELKAINQGMTTDEVVDVIGKPRQKTTDTEEIAKKLKQDYISTLQMKNVTESVAKSKEEKDLVTIFENQLDDISTVWERAEGKQNVLRYTYKNGDSESEVYFYNGKVIFVKN